MKDFATSDRLRDALLACGVEVKDSKEGTTWSSSARSGRKPAHGSRSAGASVAPGVRLRRRHLRHSRGRGSAARGRTRCARFTSPTTARSDHRRCATCSRDAKELERSGALRTAAVLREASVQSASRRGRLRRRRSTTRAARDRSARRQTRARIALFIVLDHLTDPHNVGAIVRTAECAGADGLILPDRRSAGINATVRKSAAGAAAHLPIARVGNSPTRFAR